ncbi:hypothetical protein EMIT036CA2_30242 [Chryseobacterium sp. IT-36CA2]
MGINIAFYHQLKHKKTILNLRLSITSQSIHYEKRYTHFCTDYLIMLAGKIIFTNLPTYRKPCKYNGLGSCL